MDLIIAQLINGLVLGCTYSLLATGFNLLLIVGGIIFFTYPVVIVFIMYIMWLIHEMFGVLGITICVAIGFGPLLLIMTEKIFRPIVKRDAAIQTFIMALAIGIILNFFTTQVINNGYPVSFSESLASRDAALTYGQSVISWGQIFIVVGSLLFVGLIFIILYKTMLGRALRAVAQNKEIARIVGISEFNMAIYSYTIAGLIAGMTAIFLTMSTGSAYNGLGDMLSLKMIAVVLFAGSGNLFGGLIAALILGVVETLTTAFLSGQWSNAVAFGMILFIVIFRPQGLIGSKV